MAAAALEVEGLIKQYGGRTVVDGLSLTAAPATVLALLGPNGAGKTTSVEICEGFRRADEGVVRVLGLDPRDPALRPRVGVMPQAGGAYPGLRTEEMLRLVASYARHPLDVDDLLERLALTDVRRTSYRRLSGGQQQRLSLAMAVVGRPELVFLDEPTAGLDPQARHATWDLIEALRRDGVTVLLTTHLLDEAERLADSVVVIDAGRVVAAGSVRDLTRSAGELRFRAAPGIDLTGLDGAREEAPGRYVVAGRVDPQQLADVTAWCAQKGVMIEDLRQRSLEDVFLELTGKGVRT
jgi:ABC-2 type transport system ATP-binding protein